nr:D-inositol-3-phosphate glycosyltransferase [uncultured archaeon]
MLVSAEADIIAPMAKRQPKIALVHDYLNQYGGGERVLEALAEIWPEATIYTSIVDEPVMKTWLKLDLKRVKTNFISKLPFAKTLSKHYFFLYPLAFRFQNLGDADVVISTSSYAAKFARGKEGSVHIDYIHTVPRFLWGYDTELARYYARWFDKFLAPLYALLVPPLKWILRKGDYSAAQKVDYFLANSQEVRSRVKKHYGRDAEVIHPPVDTERFKDEGQKITNEVKDEKEYYLVVSRLGGYKRVDIVVEAFNKLGRPLRIVGVGPQLSYLKSIAAPNVELLGRLDDAQVTQLIKTCKALVFPTHEDFGIVPVEAMAAGKQVIAYRGGGALETVVEGKTGVFFDKQTPEGIIEAVGRFERLKVDPQEARAQAAKFSKEVFKKKMKEFIEKVSKK